MKLTNCQNHVIEELNNFFNSEIKIFFLMGKAGTGKTTIIEQIIGRYRNKFDAIKLMASTGRAAKILKSKVVFETDTIHRLIYEEKDVQVKNTGIFQSKFVLDRNQTLGTKGTLFIIDESSMIGNTPPDEQEKHEKHLWFADEKLLKNIIEYTKNEKNKVIFVGDPYQLPAIRENNRQTPALSAEYFYQKFNLKSLEYTLNEVVRQKSDSIILQNAEQIRALIEKENAVDYYSPIESKDEVSFVYPKDFINLYTKNMDNSVVITKSNRRALIISKEIRKNMGFWDTLSDGEKLLVIKNNHSLNLMNGEIITINSVIQRNCFVEKVEIGENIVYLNVSAVKATINSITMEVYILCSYIKDFSYPKSLEHIESAITKIASLSKSHKNSLPFIQNLIRKKYRRLDKELIEDIYREYEDVTYQEFDITVFINKIISRTKNLEAKKYFSSQWFINDILDYYSKELIRKIDKDNVFYRAIAVRYGYALTCHKAQGGEYSNVFIEDNVLRGKVDLKWLYTAFTRAKDHLYIIKNNFLSDEIRKYYNLGFSIHDVRITRLKNIKGEKEPLSEKLIFPFFQLSAGFPSFEYSNSQKWLYRVYKNLKNCNLKEQEEVAKVFEEISVSSLMKEEVFNQKNIVVHYETFTKSNKGIRTEENIVLFFSKI